MKPLALLLLLMMVSTQSFGQKKKDKEAMDAHRIDSLSQVSKALTVQLDSMSKQLGRQTLQLDTVTKQLQKHEVMYTAVKEKVIRHDFDPARAGLLIDSLKTDRDKSMSGLTKGTQALTDSVSLLTEENAKLKATVTSWETRVADNEKVVRELEQLKGLFDQKIITQSEFDERKARLIAKWR